MVRQSWRRIIGRRVVATIALMIAASAGSALALINPRFTPTDLVRTSAQVFVVSVSSPKDNVVAAEVTQTLRGKPADQPKMSLHLDPNGELAEDAIKAAFEGATTAPAVMALAAPDSVDLAKDPLGAMQIGTQWFAVFKKGDKLFLDKDGRELGTVWAGSARMLAAAARYVEKDPTAAFPVKSNIVWGSELNLGKLAGRANGCVVADLGESVGSCGIVLSDGGDRVYQAAAKGAAPVDVTQKLKLTTTSRMAAVADLDADGRIDLVSWNGKSLVVASRAADGTFGTPRPLVADMAECLSLAAIDAGGKTGILVGTSRQPRLVLPDGSGGPLGGQATDESSKDLGSGGICVVADLDRDGRADVAQVFAKGLLVWTCEAPGRFKAPVKTAMRLPDKPRAAVCGDFDGDGWLDIVVGGAGGIALIARDANGRWEDQMPITGELAYHGNANQPQVINAALTDVNTDGRQAVTLFHSDRKPMAFFNRGFTCFGWARELDLAGAAGDPGAPVDPAAPPKQPLKALEALQRGQAAGTTLDLNGDGVTDLLAVHPETQEVWALMGDGQGTPPGHNLIVSLAPKTVGPMTLTVRDGGRCAGMYVVAPGMPATIGRSEPGPLVLEWMDAQGKPANRKAMAEEISRVTIPE
jgi:hypothetical protein